MLAILYHEISCLISVEATLAVSILCTFLSCVMDLFAILGGLPAAQAAASFPVDVEDDDEDDDDQVGAAVGMIRRECLIQGIQIAGNQFRHVQRRPLNLFTGELCRSKVHSKFMHQRKAQLKAERETAAEVQGNSSLKRAWNDSRLRCGDKIKGGDIRQKNEWDIAVMVCRAYMKLHRDTTSREGIDGEHRSLAIVSVVAQVWTSISTGGYTKSWKPV